MNSQQIILQLPVRCLSAGQFIASAGWSLAGGTWEHSALVVVRRGRLRTVRDGEIRRIQEHEALVIPAGTDGSGLQALAEEASEFYWALFQEGTEGGDRIGLEASAGELPEDCYHRMVSGFHQLISEKSQQEGEPLICDYRLSILLMELKQKQREAPGRAVMNRMMEYIRMHCFEKLSLGDVAESLGYTEDYLSRIFHENISCSFRQYLHQLRIRRAKQELLSDGKSIQQIAEDCGYSNAKFFSTVFQKQEGLTPSAYRNLYSGQHLNRG